MAAAAKLSPEARESIEAWKETQHTTLTFEGKIYERGDSITAKLPANEGFVSVTFQTYVTPEGGTPYVEVLDKKGISRCIRPEDINKGGKKI